MKQMIKKVMIIAMLLLIFCINGKSQVKDVYNETIDSLLVSMNHLIKDDLSKNSIEVLERSWIEFGESFILEVVFDSKTTSMLTANRISEVMSEKFQKQKRSLKRNYKSSAFMHYINEYHVLPYFFFEYFNYRFLLFAKKGESFGYALYGEYQFKATENGLTIKEKQIEILQDKEKVIQKYNACF